MEGVAKTAGQLRTGDIFAEGEWRGWRVCDVFCQLKTERRDEGPGLALVVSVSKVFVLLEIERPGQEGRRVWMRSEERVRVGC